MQIIKIILNIAGGAATVTDAWGGQAETPEIKIGMSAVLELDLRCENGTDAPDAELQPYPFEELEPARGFYIAIDSDYLQETDPKLLVCAQQAP